MQNPTWLPCSSAQKEHLMTQPTFLGQKSIFILMNFVLRPLTNRENTSLCVGSEERPNRGEGNTASRVALSRGEAEGKSTRLAVFSTRGEVLSSDPTHRDVFSLSGRGRRTKFITIIIDFCPKNLGWVIMCADEK